MTTSRPPLADSYEGMLSRAQLSLRRGDISGAATLYGRLVGKLSRLSDRVLDRRPELRDLQRQSREEYASLLRFLGRYAEAIQAMEPLLELDAEQADTWRRELAVLRTAKGDVETGLAELQTLAEELPGDPQRWVVLGREARIEGHFSRSEEALDRALDVVGQGDAETLGHIHHQRFFLFREMGRLDDAVAAWEAAVQADENLSNTVRGVHTMLVGAGRYSDALRFVARDSNPLQAGHQRGLIASLTGNPGQAQQEWQAVAELDPSAQSYGHDAWVEAVLRLGDPMPALEWLQGALGGHGTARLLVLSGMAWAMNDDPDMAGALFQQAISLLRAGRPSKKKLDSADWRLLDSLVTDQDVKTELRSYFAVVETVWDQLTGLPRAGDAPQTVLRP